MRLTTCQLRKLFCLSTGNELDVHMCWVDSPGRWVKGIHYNNQGCWFEIDHNKELLGSEMDLDYLESTARIE